MSETLVESNLSAVESQYFKPKTTEKTIVLSKCHSCVLRILLWFQTVLTLVSIGISMTSVYKTESELSMSRPFYWWYFFFSSIILLLLYQSIYAINKKSDNNDDFSCFMVSVFAILFIEMAIVSQFFLVSLPPNKLIDQELGWEPIVLYLVSALRISAFFVILYIIISYLRRYNDNWDVSDDIRLRVTRKVNQQLNTN